MTDPPSFKAPQRSPAETETPPRHPCEWPTVSSLTLELDPRSQSGTDTDSFGRPEKDSRATYTNCRHFCTLHNPVLMGTQAVYPPLSGRETECVHAKAPCVSLLAISSTFDSLFRVLFTFPSQYFCAIGFPAVFSFGWDLPPVKAALSSNPTL